MSLRVGLCIPKGKKSRIRLPERIEDLCISTNITLIDIDMSTDIDTQGPFDIILHKVLDYFKEGVDTTEANQKINKFVSYIHQHPEIVVIDDLEWCWSLTNRKLMIELIHSCQFKLNGIKVFLPKTIDVTEAMTSTDITDEIAKKGVKFPVISKAYSAFFGADAHEMSVLFSEECLTSNLEKPCLLQEFSNHGGLLYKVFVVGKKFNICERPSIKNLDPTKSPAKTIHFDSFRVSKTGQSYIEDLHASDPNKRKWRNCDELPNMLDGEVVGEIISRIQSKTGLYLFGFDILVEDGTGNYGLIDINRFPSYAGIGEEHFPKHLVELFLSF